MNVKQQSLHYLRRARLLELVDRLRFRWLSARSRDARRAFTRAHPDTPLPPDDIAYDAYGLLHWEFYWGFGRTVADFLAPRILEYGRSGRVLEWGCGPGRIVRHLPAALGSGWLVHGTDANRRTIEWCSRYLPTIHFAVNGVDPPLPFPADHFDCVYSVSVFTHLSPDHHRSWIGELTRVLKPGGLLICTLNGDASRPLLLPFEQADYDAGRLVTRGEVTGGTRCFIAYHPPAYVRQELLRGFELITQVPAPNLFGERQDIWFARLRYSPA
jgi:SAM-dependent methyltransferase